MSTDRSHKMNFRIDFVVEVLDADVKAGTLTLDVKPHPRRYEWVHKDGEKLLYDKLDNSFFPESVVHDMMQRLLAEMPSHRENKAIEAAEPYTEGRKDGIRRHLAGERPSSPLEDKSDRFLADLEADTLEFVILSLDIVGSTKLANSLPPERYRILIEVVLYEVSELVAGFNGHVLKYTGDGIIAYFPSPSFIIKNDLALDCALTLQYMVYGALNPSLAECGYTPIDIRIGIDSGAACVAVIGSSNTKRHKDIIGSVVNLAVKIQGLAPDGGICLGGTTIRSLHTMWRELTEQIALPESWPYKYCDGKPYEVFRVVPGRRLKSVCGPD